jgi:hypothetical protein
MGLFPQDTVSYQLMWELAIVDGHNGVTFPARMAVRH